MGSDDDLLALFQLWNDDIVPVWQRSCDGQLQRLEHGELSFGGAILVASVLGNCLEVGVLSLHWWWGDVEGSAPDQHLSLAVLLGSFGLVEAGESSVVTLVQSPGLLDWDSSLTGLFQDGVEGDLGASKD